jgi:hypothetical protein
MRQSCELVVFLNCTLSIFRRQLNWLLAAYFFIRKATFLKHAMTRAAGKQPATMAETIANRSAERRLDGCVEFAGRGVCNGSPWWYISQLTRSFFLTSDIHNNPACGRQASSGRCDTLTCHRFALLATQTHPFCHNVGPETACFHCKGTKRFAEDALAAP